MIKVPDIDSSSRRPLRIGYLGLSDAAPLIIAEEKGFYDDEGLRVHLCKEVGWATIREKLLCGELDAAQAPAPMLWAAHLGLGGVAFEACTALILNLHGNAITLSSRLSLLGVNDTASLRREALKRRGEQKLVFGVVYPYSSHNMMLRAWLGSAGLVPDRDVRIAIVPPMQMLATLASGAIDGFMAGEPWTSLAVATGEGWCPTWSAEMAPCHVEKVLMVRKSFAERDAATHSALVRAVARAGVWCDDVENRPALAGILSKTNRLNVSESALMPAFTGQFDCGMGSIKSVPNFLVFHRFEAQVPSKEKALRIQNDLISAGLISRDGAGERLPSTLFREDLYRTAVKKFHETIPALV